MKKLLKRIAYITASVAVATSASLFIFTGTAHGLAWSPTATGLDHPGFNIFTGVPGVGDESNFLRGRVSGSSNDFVNPVNDACANNTQYSVQVYVHNGANQSLNNNGTGPAVAHDTKVKVSVPTTTANAINATISASNASSVNDSMKINCNGKTMQLSYVPGSAVEQEQFDGTVVPLSDNIVTTGALIGSHAADGNMWGCFEQRVIVYMKVQVKEVPKPPVTPPVSPPFTPPVTPPTTPPTTVLPNTGSGNLLGIFGGVTVLGAVLHRLYTLRKARG